MKYFIIIIAVLVLLVIAIFSVFRNKKNREIELQELEEIQEASQRMDELIDKKSKAEEEISKLENKLKELKEQYFSKGEKLCNEIGHSFEMKSTDYTLMPEELDEVFGFSERRKWNHVTFAKKEDKKSGYIGICPICGKQEYFTYKISHAITYHHVEWHFQTISYGIFEKFTVSSDEAKVKIEDFKKQNSKITEEIKKTKAQIGECYGAIFDTECEIKEYCAKAGHEYMATDEKDKFECAKCGKIHYTDGGNRFFSGR